MEWFGTLVWLHRLATMDVGPGEVVTLFSWAWWIAGFAGAALLVAGFLMPTLLSLLGGRVSVLTARVAGIAALAMALMLFGMNVAKHAAQDQLAAERERLRAEFAEADRTAIDEAQAAAMQAARQRDEANRALDDLRASLTPDRALKPGDVHGGGISPKGAEFLGSMLQKRVSK